LWTWGFNSSGQLGQGDTVARSSPTKVGSSTWKTVHMGQTGINMYALDTNNKLWYCGNPTGGAAAGYAYGFGETVARSTLVQLAGITTWYDFGANNIIQRLGGLWPYSNGDLYEWGSNVYGMLGDGTTQSRSSPVQVATTRYVNTMASPVQISTSLSWSQVSAGWSYTLGLTTSGVLAGWGYNSNGMLGSLDTVSTYIAPSSVTTTYFTYSIGSGGISNLDGTPGNGGDTTVSFNGVSILAGGGAGGNSTNPGAGGAGGIATGGTTNVPGGKGGSRNANIPGLAGAGGGVAAADLPTVTVDNTNGVSQNGQAGADITPTYFTALAALGVPTGNAGVGPSTSYVAATSATGFGSGGGSGSYSTAGNGYLGGGGGGLVAGSGYGYRGVGGNGGQGCIIVKLTSTLGVVVYQLLTSGNIFYPPANTSTVELWVVGAGGAGAGNNTTGPSTSSNGGGGGAIAYRSFTLGSFTNNNVFTNISAGQYTVISTKVDPYPQLMMWGYNGYGQLGINTIQDASSPVQITSTPNPYYYISNTLVLPSSATIATSSPVQVGTSSWSQVSAGANHTIAKDSTGLLFTWGKNTNGQLGDGTTINKSSPVQISSSSFTSVSAGSNYNVIKQSDGSIYSFGSNSNGQLGDGT
jgi:alpha-tubulin suppressor-like RCC1 family protein